MNLNPFPDSDDVIVSSQVKIPVMDMAGQDHQVESWVVAFQGNDRPELMAYGATEKAAVAELYNDLVNYAQEDDDDE